MALADDITLDDIDRSHHDVLARLRDDAPVVWVPALDGWVVLTRELCVAVMRDAVSFTVDDPRFSTAQVVGPSMLSLDGTEHARHRDPFVHAFRPAEVTRRHAEAVPALARALVDDLRPHGVAELRRGLAGPLAVGVVARSLELDGVDPVHLLGWYDAIVAAVGEVSCGSPVPESGSEAYGSLAAALMAAVERDGSLLHGVTDSLSDDEIVSNAAVFLFGGIETSEGMTTSLLWHVLSEPDVVTRLRADRSLCDTAVEESLRLEPAAARVDRYATTDVEIGGARIARGDLVIVSLAAANRDPAAYDEPDRFMLDRPTSRTHVAFAQGPHACIGAQLARLEARAALDAVLDLPGVALAGPTGPTGVIFRKPAALHVRWAV